MAIHRLPSAAVVGLVVKITPARLALCLLFLAGTAMPASGEYPRRELSGPAQRANAVTPKECSPASSAPPALTKQPNYRQIVVLVQTAQDRPSPKLSSTDLRLYQGDKPRQIAFFEPQAARVGIVVDTSESMGPKLPAAELAVKAIVDNLRPPDEFFLVAFSSQPFLLAGPTSDPASVIKIIKILHAYGQTAFYDSFMSVLYYLFRDCPEAKSLVLISDGMDNASQNNIGQMTDMARKMDVTVYAIGIGDPNIKSSSLIPLLSRDGEALNMTGLAALAKETRGEAFTLPINGSDAALKQITSTVADKLGNRYIVGFIGDGSTSQLRVEASKDKAATVKILAID